MLDAECRVAAVGRQDPESAPVAAAAFAFDLPFSLQSRPDANTRKHNR